MRPLTLAEPRGPGEGGSGFPGPLGILSLEIVWSVLLLEDSPSLKLFEAVKVIVPPFSPSGPFSSEKMFPWV